MRKKRIEYDSPLDAIIAIAKRLSTYEEQYKMSSEDFFNKFQSGQMEDSVDFVEWANDYQHFISIKVEIERDLQHAT